MRTENLVMLNRKDLKSEYRKQKSQSQKKRLLSDMTSSKLRPYPKCQIHKPMTAFAEITLTVACHPACNFENIKGLPQHASPRHQSCGVKLKPCDPPLQSEAFGRNRTHNHIGDTGHALYPIQHSAGVPASCSLPAFGP